MNKESIDKQVFLEEVYNSAFNDELEKIAIPNFLKKVTSIKSLPKWFSGLSRGKKAVVATSAVGGSLVPIQPEYVPHDNKDVSPTVKNRWGRIQKLVDSHGVYAGTNFKRVSIPKSKLSEKSLYDLGFKKSYIAVPESGQDQWASYRHADQNYHVHSHPKEFVFHKDKHAASQMIAKKRRSIAGKVKAFTVDSSHFVTEGIPGYFNYLKSVSKQMLSRQKAHLSENVKKESKNLMRNINRWRDEK